MFLLAALLSGCCCMPSSMPFMEDDPAHPSPLEPGLKFDTEPRDSLIPRAIEGFPEPAVGIVSSQCGDLTNGGGVEGPGCITAKLKCNETVIGHTIGGVDRFDSKFYEKAMCWPKLVNHDGGDERIYRLDMPEGEWTAAVVLDSPCADLNLMAVKWNGDDCPNSKHIIPQCEGIAGPEPRHSVRLVSQHASTWYIAVEGRNEEEGAFALTTMCRRGLQ